MMPAYRNSQQTGHDQGDLKDSDQPEQNEKHKLSPHSGGAIDSNDKHNGDQDYATDEETGNTNAEPFDFEDKIKKETIPIHSNPFMSYLHMQLNRGFEQSVGTIPTSSLQDSIPSPVTTTKKFKNHQRSDQINNNNSHNSTNNNFAKSTAGAHQMAYDLSLNISSQRLNIIKPS